MLQKRRKKKVPSKISQSHYILGMVIGTFILILSISMMVQISKDSEITVLQQKGATYNRLLKDLLREVQLYRGMANSILTEEDWEELNIESNEAMIDYRFQRLQEYNAKEMTALETSALYHLRTEWESIRKNGEKLQPKEMEKRMTALIEGITDYMVNISDQSKLMVSNDLPVHYLVHDVVVNLPSISENLGILRLEGRKILESNKITEDQFRRLYHAMILVNQSLAELEHGKEVFFSAKPSMRDNLEELSKRVIEESENFLHLVENEILYGPLFSKSPEEFFVHATDTIDQIFLLYDVETIELERYLNEELKRLRWERLLLFLAAIVSVGFIVYCFYHCFRSIKKTIEQVKAEMERIVEGKRKVEAKYKETEHRLQEIETKFSRAILQAHEEERKRVSRELHDGIGQALYSIIMLLRVIEREPKEEKRLQYIQKTKEITSDAMKEVKQISRSLRPSALDDLGFIPALTSYIEDYEKMYDIVVTFTYKGEKERLHPKLETALYRICQEAFTNIAKHAQATKIQVLINNKGQCLSLIIKDNGKGFNTKKENCSGLGLYSMKERAEGVGGTFQVFSKPDEGTTIKIIVPKLHFI